jgi:flagellar biosynthesis protein FlhG
MMKLNNSRTKIVTVASGKGGVGKSSLALNLGIELSRHGKKPLIIDTDFGFSNIDVMLGVHTRHDLLDVIEGRKSVTEVIETGLGGVKFISGGSGVYELLKMAPDQLMEIVSGLVELEDVADTIIFDTSAGLSDSAMRLIRASHETILVTTPEPTSVVDAYALLKIVHEQGDQPHISLVINKVTGPREAATVMEGFARIAEKNLNIRVGSLGHITQDASMQNAIKMQVPILVSFPRCAAAADIRTLAQRYLNIPAKPQRKLGMAAFLEYFLSKNNVYRES